MKVIDMHCDTMSELMLARNRGQTLRLRENDLHIDLMKLRRGGYLLQNFAMFIHRERDGDATAALLRMIDLYHNEIAANADMIGEVLTCGDIEENAAQGKLSAMLTMEEGAPCRGDVRLLRDFYRLGVRMMTLTWNFENELAWPNTVKSLPGCVSGSRYGLKAAGFEFVEEMERLGMIVDVSHLSDDGFYDVCAAAKKPFVASHSNARALCGHPRNLTDDMIRRLADHGGVTGINFCAAFLTERGGKSRVGDMAAHIKHIADVGGIGCVGLGSDYDGIDCALEMENCAHIQLLAQEMSRRGFSDGDIEKVFYQNVLRVYRDTLG